MEVSQNTSLVICPHPLLAGADRKIITQAFIPGETIGQFLMRQEVALPREAVLTLDDEVVTFEDWARVCPRNGQIITIRALVQGGGGSNPLRIVLMIAVMIAAPYLAPQLAGAIGVSVAIAKAGLMIAGAMIVNAIAPPPSPDMPQLRDDGKESPTYSLSGGSNQMRPFQPLPLILGEHRVFPDLGAREYTEFYSDDQFLYQIFNFGVGEIETSDLHIGDTLLSDYDEVELEVAGADGKLGLFPGNVDTTNGGELKYNAPIERASSQDTSYLAVDVSGSLFHVGDNGLENHRVRIKIEYRPIGDSNWSLYKDFNITNGSRKPVRKTYKWSVNKGQYEVRITRLTADDSSDKDTSELNWSALRSYQSDTADYTGQNRLALKIRASGQLSSRVDRLSALVKAKVPVWDGSDWSVQNTSNPAWIFLYFARGIYINDILVAGCGLPDDRIDIDMIKAWAVFCDAEKLSCNVVIDSQQSRAQVLTIIAQCGRGGATWQTGKLGAVWDEADKPVTAVFGMANIKAGSYKVQYITQKLADEIEVKFVNPDLNWGWDTVRTLVPGVITPKKTASITFTGCTNKTQAGEHANLQAARQVYHRKRISWETDMEGLAVVRGDVVLLSHDLSQWGVSGRLESGTASVLKLARPVTFSANVSNYVMVRHPDGRFETREVEFSPVKTNEITLLQPLPWVVNDYDGTTRDFLFSFAPLATPGKKLKIVDVEPVSDYEVRLHAIEENPDYYLSKNNSYFHNVVRHEVIAPYIVWARASEELVATGNSYAVRLTVDWVYGGDYRGAVVRAGVEVMADIRDGVRASFIVPDSGNLQISIIPGGSFYAKGEPYLFSYQIKGKTYPPANVQGFVVDRMPDGTRQFSWHEVADVDCAGYVIRYKLGVADSWDEMTPLHNGILTHTPWETNQLAAGFYTTAIKAVDTGSRLSTQATFIQSTLGDPRIQDALYYDSPHSHAWPGIKTNCAADNTGTRLFAVGKEIWDDLPDDWDSWDSWVMQPPATIAYQDEIDLEVEVSFLPLISAGSNGQQIIEISTSTDNNSWTSWQVPDVQITCRYLRYRVTVSPIDDPYLYLDNLTVILSGDTLNEVINDADTAGWEGSVVAGRIIPIQKNYSQITQIMLALQGVGAGFTWEVINKDKDQPKVRIFDNGVPADALVDVQVSGLQEIA